MAAMQTPEWETRTTHKKSIFSVFSNPFNNNGPSPDHKKSLWSMKSPFSSVDVPAGQGAMAKETGANDEVTPTQTLEVRSRWQQKRTRIMIGGLFLLVLILAIGLAVGLSKKGKSKSKSQNLPLPSNTATFSGEITYYSPGPGYGACGFENTAKDPICAVSQIIFDASAIDGNPNHNPLCGKKIRIIRNDGNNSGNHSVDVTVVDRCVGCKATDLDLSLAMFTSLADEALGRTTASWAWLN